MKRIQNPISCFYERAFLYFSRLELHDFTPFKPKYSGENPKTPPPFPQYILNIKNHCVICVVVYRGSQLQKDLSLPKIKLNVNNCLESIFTPYFCRRKRGQEQSKPVFSPFFSACQKFSESWTPLTKIPGSASVVHEAIQSDIQTII